MEQNEQLVMIAVCEAAIAITFSCVIIFSFWRFKLLRGRRQQPILFMSIADVGANLAAILGAGRDYSPCTVGVKPMMCPTMGSAMCNFQGMSMQFFELASVLWSFVLAFTLWRTMLGDKIMGRACKSHVVVWGLSLGLTILPASTRSYGPAGPWCWIDGSTTGTMWRFASFYVPVWIICVSDIAFMVSVFRRVRSFYDQGLLAATDPAAEKLQRLTGMSRWFPVVLVFSWTIATSIRIYDWLDGHNSRQWVSILQVVFRGAFLQSVLNSIVYGFNPVVRAQWRALLDETCSSTPGGWCLGGWELKHCCCFPRQSRSGERDGTPLNAHVDL